MSPPPSKGRRRRLEGKPHERSAGVVAAHENAERRRFLLLSVRTFSGGERWEFPKGAIEQGETEEQAATREFREESGLERVDLVEGFRVPIRYFYRREGRLVLKEVVYFLGTTPSDAVKISFESTGFTWADRDEANKMLRGYPDLQALLAKADEELSRRKAAEPATAGS